MNTSHSKRIDPVRIGCASGFWGDSDEGAIQLVSRGGIDYLVFDYLAEITMSILSRMRQRDPAKGFIPDFVSGVLVKVLAEACSKGIKVVANAGGVNPAGCRDALEALMKELGVEARVAVVLGDDVLSKIDEYRAAGVCEMERGEPIPAMLSSASAYLGARPIAAALDAGADIVITGRCVDSAVVLGPLIHEFGWSETDYDQLSAGTLLGHLVECGCMGTGGVFTDWDTVEGWDDMGYPVVECHPDGSGVITKPEGTGGLVTCASVAEQMVYEIGDPAAYLMPDVTCDWTRVTLSQRGANEVQVSGARGRPPTRFYKVCATYGDGYKAVTSLTVAGERSVEKARRIAAAILARARRRNAAAGIGDFDETSVEVIGSEQMYGADAVDRSPREAMFKIAVRHRQREAVEMFCREVMPSLTATAPGICGFFAGRPKPAEVTRLFSFLAPKEDIRVTVQVGQNTFAVPAPLSSPSSRFDPPPGASGSEQPPDVSATSIPAPLRSIACARSGDKGDNANIGVVARSAQAFDFLKSALTEEVVRGVFAHFLRGRVTRYELPGIGALNFVLELALGGGGASSLRIDPQGKCFASILLDHEIDIPRSLLPQGGDE